MGRNLNGPSGGWSNAGQRVPFGGTTGKSYTYTPPAARHWCDGSFVRSDGQGLDGLGRGPGGARGWRGDPAGHGRDLTGQGVGTGTQRGTKLGCGRAYLAR
eukprot:5295372-Prymnesium_polylepis.1